MTSNQETDQAYSNKKPQLPEPAQGLMCVHSLWEIKHFPLPRGE